VLKKTVFIVFIIVLYAAGCATETPDRDTAAESNAASNLENFVIDKADGPVYTNEQTAAGIKTDERAGAEPETNEPDIIDSAAEPQLSNKTRDIDTARPDGFVFVYKNVDVVLGAAVSDVLDKLGPATDYYEYPSCAFEGDAKIYVYGGFEVATYRLYPEDNDRVYSVTFFDDSAATAEGVYIGQSRADMAAAYGADYEEIPGSFLYEKNGTTLSFTVENGIITVITYFIADIYN